MLITQGTVSVANGGTMVTGVGTGWLTVGIVPGTSIFFVDAAPGHATRIARIANQTTIHLAEPWDGGTHTNVAYTIRVDFTSLGMPLPDETAVDIPALWDVWMARTEERLAALGAPVTASLPRIDEQTTNVPDLWNSFLSEVEARVGILTPPTPPPPASGIVEYGGVPVAFGGVNVEF